VRRERTKSGIVDGNIWTEIYQLFHFYESIWTKLYAFLFSSVPQNIGQVLGQLDVGRVDLPWTAWALGCCSLDHKRVAIWDGMEEGSEPKRERNSSRPITNVVVSSTRNEEARLRHGSSVWRLLLDEEWIQGKAKGRV
jgi:hypothetical protein